MASPTQLRSGVHSLTVLANGDLAKLWQQLSSAAQAREALMDILPALVVTYGAAAATLAADWYDDARLKADARGRFVAEPADLSRTGTSELARWGISPLFQAEPDFVAALTLIQGGLQRRIANAGRRTIVTSSVRDPGARGWARVGDGSTCGFCSMLLGRGAVYTEASADFQAHDHCGCMAVPAF